MFKDFETYIRAEASFTNEEIRLMRALSAERKFSKKQLLLREGEICRNKIFVTKGLLRTYRAKADGTEYVMRFAAEHSWTMDMESYNNQTPSKYNIEALEDTEVMLWSRENLELLVASVPAFKSYSERLKAVSLDASQNRVFMNISSTPEEKYEDFVTSFPEVFRRVPLHMVASYLGVSRETLSRVRRHAHRQQDRHP